MRTELITALVRLNHAEIVPSVVASTFIIIIIIIKIYDYSKINKIIMNIKNVRNVSTQLSVSLSQTQPVREWVVSGGSDY